MSIRHCAAVALIALATALPAAAADGWHARFAATWTDTDLGYRRTDAEGTTASLRGDDSPGFGLGLERRLTEALGLELGIDASRPEARLNVAASGFDPITARARMDLWTIRAGLNLHLVSDGPLDLYLGPTVAWLSPGSLRFRARVDDRTETLRIEADSCFGWGGTAGAELALGDGWTLGVSYTYLKAEMDFSPEDDPEEVALDLDPSTLRLGLGVRF